MDPEWPALHCTFKISTQGNPSILSSQRCSTILEVTEPSDTISRISSQSCLHCQDKVHQKSSNHPFFQFSLDSVASRTRSKVHLQTSQQHPWYVSIAHQYLSEVSLFVRSAASLCRAICVGGWFELFQFDEGEEAELSERAGSQFGEAKVEKDLHLFHKKGLIWVFGDLSL